MAAAYKRIVLKLSGEGLAGAKGVGFDTEMVDGVAKVIRQLVEMGIQVGVVVGGGNIWRGRHTNAMNPVTADHMGMLATCINALCIQDALERLGLEAHTMTSVQMLNFAELYTRRDAVRHLAIRILPPILRLRSGPPKSGLMRCSRAPRWTRFTTAIRARTPTPGPSRILPIARP